MPERKSPASPNLMEGRPRFAFLLEDEERLRVRPDTHRRRIRLRRVAAGLGAVLAVLSLVAVSLLLHYAAGDGARYTLVGTIQDRYTNNMNFGVNISSDPDLSPRSLVTVTNAGNTFLGAATLGAPQSAHRRMPWVGRYTEDTYKFRIVGLPKLTSSEYFVSIDGRLRGSYTYDELVSAHWSIRL